MDEHVAGALTRVLADIADEREAQDRLWGLQEFPDGTGPTYTRQAEAAKADCAAAHTRGELTWRHILTEEFLEALAEEDPARLREELVQTAAVAVKWIQSIDTRHAPLPQPPAKEKLVRDRIPEIIQATGRTPATRVATPDEYRSLLHTKLQEEASEYLESEDPTELADLLEVITALAVLHNLPPSDLERLRAEKATERGGFTHRYVLTLDTPPR